MTLILTNPLLLNSSLDTPPVKNENDLYPFVPLGNPVVVSKVVLLGILPPAVLTVLVHPEPPAESTGPGYLKSSLIFSPSLPLVDPSLAPEFIAGSAFDGTHISVKLKSPNTFTTKTLVCPVVLGTCKAV